METAAIVIAGLSMLGTLGGVLVAYFAWKRQEERQRGAAASAAKQAESLAAQARALEEQRDELAKTRQIADDAFQASTQVNLRVLLVRRRPRPPDETPVAGVFSTTKVNAVVRNLGPAVAKDLRLEQIHIGNNSFAPGLLDRRQVSSLGPGEEWTFVVDTGVRLPGVFALSSARVTVSLAGKYRRWNETLSYP